MSYGACGSHYLLVQLPLVVRDGGDEITLTQGCGTLNGPSTVHLMEEGLVYEFSIDTTALTELPLQFQYVAPVGGQDCSSPYGSYQVQNYIARTHEMDSTWIQLYGGSLNISTCQSSLTGTEIRYGIQPGEDTCPPLSNITTSNCMNPSLLSYYNDTFPGSGEMSYNIFIQVVAESDGLLVVEMYSCFPAHALIRVRGQGLIHGSTASRRLCAE